MTSTGLVVLSPSDQKLRRVDECAMFPSLPAFCTWYVAIWKGIVAPSLLPMRARILERFFCRSPRVTQAARSPLALLMRIMERVREKVGLPALTPHTLRHQRCTILKRAGVDLDDIALVAGHKSTKTTRLYIHLAPTDLSKRIRTKVEPFDAPVRALIEQVLAVCRREAHIPHL